MITHRTDIHWILAVALACAGACANGAFAAELVITPDSYSPLLAQPTNWQTSRFAQVAPTQGVAPAPNPAAAPSAQPGQSTTPAPSSTVQPTPPPQGAQPGQSTVPSPSSTPLGTSPSPGAAGPNVVPGAGPGGAPAMRRPGVVVPPVQAPQTQVVVPPQQQIVSPPDQAVAAPADVAVPAPAAPSPSPFLDDGGEELPVIEEQNGEFVKRRGVRPYGGGRPSDWPWGCNGSPYRTQGMCDDWKVGCRWHITVDGLVWSHDDADLNSIDGQMLGSFPAYVSNNIPTSAPPTRGDGLVNAPTFEQFEDEGGARITLTSQIAKLTGWDVQVVYEGVPEWNASIVYPKQAFQFDFPLNPDPAPPDPFPEGTLQRSLHYRSSLHSAEINVLTPGNKTWRPVFGVRYFNFDDEINDSINHQAQPPLAGPSLPIDVDPGLDEDFLFQPIGPSVTTDRVNIFDIQNNLIGFQVGLLHDTWQVTRRLAFEGTVNGGVYYNKIKYTNLMGTFTTQVYADNTNSIDFDESRVDFSDTVNNDVREYSEIAYHAEASLTGVCRLNRCWALRGGYQVLWIDNVHVAEDAYLGAENVNRDLLFHGWHAGIECRR